MCGWEFCPSGAESFCPRFSVVDSDDVTDLVNLELNQFAQSGSEEMSFISHNGPSNFNRPQPLASVTNYGPFHKAYAGPVDTHSGLVFKILLSTKSPLFVDNLST